MRIRTLAALAASAIAAFAPGCAYLSARGRDATDIISAGVSNGGGLGIRLDATRLIALSVIAQKDENFLGWNARNNRWTESGYGLGFASWRMPTIDGEDPVPDYWYDFFSTSRERTLFPNRKEIQDVRHTLFIYSGVSGNRLVDLLDVRAHISVFASALEITIKPVELADFLLGWFGIDIAGDDGTPYGENASPPLHFDD